MADIFGAVAASLTLCQQCCQSALVVRSYLGESSVLEDEVHDLELKQSAECRRLVALKCFLFDTSITGGGRTLYEQCSDRGQQDIAQMLERLQTSLTELRGITEKYRPLNDASPTYAINETKVKLRWSLWDKAKATTILNEVKDWNDRIRQDVLACCIPLTFFSSTDQLATIATRSEIQDFGIAGDISLRRLLLNTVPLDIIRFDRSSLRIQHGVEPFQVALVVRGKLSGKYVLLNHKEPISILDSRQETTKQRVNQLSNLLFQAKAAIELPVLTCHGVFEDKVLVTGQTEDAMRFAFVFQIPPNVDPFPSALTSLFRGDLARHRPCLEDRIRLASTIASSLLKIHLLGWFHKSLSSSNILFFREKAKVDDGNSKAILPKITKPYLYGFDYSRPSNAFTSLRALPASLTSLDALPDGLLYQHPDRWCEPAHSFSAKHDLYALGIILLEIGMWQDVRTITSSALRPKDLVGLQIEEVGERIRQRVVERTRTKLGFYVGRRYQKVVLKCLGDMKWEMDDGETEQLMSCRQEVVDVLRDLDRAELG